MARDDRKVNRNNSGNRFWSGLLLLAAGGLLMAKQLGAQIPDWLFSWHVLLIAIGLMISFKSGFRNAGGLIMVLVGVAFMLNDLIPNAHMQDYIWPGILILAGIVFILRPSSHSHHNKKDEWKDWKYGKFITEPLPDVVTPKVESAPEEDAEFIEINAVFGSVNKLILSKNFKGGEVNAFMGGSEINLLQADIKQPVVLEINNVFGGTKLLVPGNWDLKNNIAAVFGGVEDKRNPGISAPDPGKVIILKGACVFGGIEIRNF
jgi:predicted membrane protein